MSHIGYCKYKRTIYAWSSEIYLTRCDNHLFEENYNYRSQQTVKGYLGAFTLCLYTSILYLYINNSINVFSEIWYILPLLNINSTENWGFYLDKFMVFLEIVLYFMLLGSLNKNILLFTRIYVGWGNLLAVKFIRFLEV